MENYRRDEMGELRRELDRANGSLRELEQELSSTQARLKASREDVEELRGRLHARGWRSTKPILATGIATAIVMALAMLLFESCRYDDTVIPAGVVTDRYHHPAWVQLVCTGGKTPSCHTVHHPERWSIRIAHDGHERVVGVHESQWDRVTMGQWFCPNTPCPPEPQSEERR